MPQFLFLPLLFFLFLVDIALGLSFPITQEARHQHLTKRGSELDVINVRDRFYNVNISLGGANFTLGLDTGSSDLWVSGLVPNTSIVHKNASLSYNGGIVSGWTGTSHSPSSLVTDDVRTGIINTAELRLDNITIQDQAYLNADTVRNPIGGADGLFGVGPSSISAIQNQFSSKSSTGDTVLSRIFSENTSLENYFSIALSRSSGAESPGNLLQDDGIGKFTIGEVIPRFEDILKSPQLPVISDQYGSQHWETLLDLNGIIGPDGQRINTSTRINKPQGGAQDRLRVTFDTGYTIPQASFESSSCIGKNEGITSAASERGSRCNICWAHWDNFWTIPCDYELNISFVFAEQVFSIAPLDLTQQGLDSDRKLICAARFQQMNSELIQDQGFGALDVIFGMAFLRNVYLLVHVGTFVKGAAQKTPAYIQLLSTVDRDIAHTDFVNARLNGTDTTASQPALLGQNQTLHSPPIPSSSVPIASAGQPNNGVSEYIPVLPSLTFVIFLGGFYGIFSLGLLL
ncbi:hypothetical protein D9757_000505 [Collybiopsis confluens]|uniref:Peptidase A1 domain-containing protein n=1 Tax=Collybiopsis confluens TaxID=2823264 RepID=A0A8H5I1I2_9AGAR|nr:hypothetical protein D9757_000505 [Collybiopsis confluens]